MQGEMSREALQASLGLADRKSFRERYLKPALDAGLIDMTIPDRPGSRLQKYRLTENGENLRKTLSPGAMRKSHLVGRPGTAGHLTSAYVQ